MKRNKRTIRRLKYYNLIFSSVSGIALITALILLFSYAASAAGMSDGIISVLGSLAICSGGYFSGFLYGKQKRHKGIKNGVICGINNLCRYFFSRNNLLKRNSSVSFNTLSDYAVYCRSRRRSNRRQFKNKTSSPLTILSIHKNHVIFVYFFGKKLLKKLIECGIMFSC